ncbi:MAG: hypothetical protein KC501_24435, partial [Myxococcales bacterium]|nr:hypothetical protein [Myxococcales bacterium]
MPTPGDSSTGEMPGITTFGGTVDPTLPGDASATMGMEGSEGSTTTPADGTSTGEAGSTGPGTTTDIGTTTDESSGSTGMGSS